MARRITAEELAPYCGPSAVASALGISKLDAARRILDARKMLRSRIRGRGWSTITEIAHVCGLRRVVRVFLSPDEHGAGPSYRQRYARTPRMRCPTVVQWLRTNPHREAIVLASHHFMHVRNGEIIEANGRAVRRGRVTHVVYLD